VSFILVTDPASGEQVVLDLGQGYRQNPPVAIAGIGPVIAYGLNDADIARLATGWNLNLVASAARGDYLGGRGRTTRRAATSHVGSTMKFRNRSLLNRVLAVDTAMTGAVGAGWTTKVGTLPHPPYRHQARQCNANALHSWGVFQAIKDSQWSADHIAAHGVTLDEVRQAILEHPVLDDHRQERHNTDLRAHPYWPLPVRGGR
jgi:hypothetical protein